MGEVKFRLEHTLKILLKLVTTNFSGLGGIPVIELKNCAPKQAKY